MSLYEQALREALLRLPSERGIAVGATVYVIVPQDDGPWVVRATTVTGRPRLFDSTKGTQASNWVLPTTDPLGAFWCSWVYDNKIDATEEVRIRNLSSADYHEWHRLKYGWTINVPVGGSR